MNPHGRQLPGLIYFLLEEDTGRLKIGWSGRSVAYRVRSFRCGNSNALKLVGIVPGTKSDEATLHRKFARYRLPGRREWFECVVEMRVEVDRIIEANGMVPILEG